MAVAHLDTDLLATAADPPAWLSLVDRVVIVLVNLALLFQVTIVVLIVFEILIAFYQMYFKLG